MEDLPNVLCVEETCCEVACSSSCMEKHKH
jgi:hypothetical protein